jgi:hypothetical protein
MANKGLHLTTALITPLVMTLADAKPAPIDFADENTLSAPEHKPSLKPGGNQDEEHENKETYHLGTGRTYGCRHVHRLHF